MTTIHLDFDPSRDGFSFPNRFSWTDDDLDTLASRLRPASAVPLALVGALGGRASGRRGALAGFGIGAALGAAGAGRGLIRAIATRWPSFGLCGGMALAAIERWPQKSDTSTADLQQGPVRALLRRRQERTLRASLPRFASGWLRALASRDDRAWPADLRREIDRIQVRLAQGRPALVGLIGDAPDPFSLHQVVVFGVDRRGPLEATLHVYDPNAPGQTRTITTHVDSAGASIATTIPTGPGRDGRVRISRRPGHLHHLFRIDAEDR